METSFGDARKRRPHHRCPGPNCDERDVSKWVADGVYTPPAPVWLPEINTVEYRNAIMPHFRELLAKMDANDGTMYDSNLRCFLDQVLGVTHDTIDKLLAGNQRCEVAGCYKAAALRVCYGCLDGDSGASHG